MTLKTSIPTGAINADDIDALCDALLQLQSADEMRRFLRDLTTPGELQALAERWRVARCWMRARNPIATSARRPG
jgi:uncharacterized protein YerC